MHGSISPYDPACMLARRRTYLEQIRDLLSRPRKKEDEVFIDITRNSSETEQMWYYTFQTFLYTLMKFPPRILAISEDE